jgi:hypothetical protein
MRRQRKPVDGGNVIPCTNLRRPLLVWLIRLVHCSKPSENIVGVKIPQSPVGSVSSPKLQE